MNQTDIGKFIAKCRKEKKLTQAQLAEKLNITDRAVSKWETGKSMPDSSIMLELCEILGITVNELLSGEEIDMENYGRKADENLIALKRNIENRRKDRTIRSALFSAIFIVGIVVCLICDMATSGGVTWSSISVTSIVFAWSIFFPAVLLGKKGIVGSLLSLSVIIVPYLYLMSHFVQVKEVFSVGAVTAAASIVFLWFIVAVFLFAGKKSKLFALGIIFLSAIPFVFILNVILSKLIGEPIVDVWDILTVFLLLILAVLSFMFHYAGRHREKGD